MIDDLSTLTLTFLQALYIILTAIKYDMGDYYLNKQLFIGGFFKVKRVNADMLWRVSFNSNK